MAKKSEINEYSDIRYVGVFMFADFYITELCVAEANLG